MEIVDLWAGALWWKIGNFFFSPSGVTYYEIDPINTYNTNSRMSQAPQCHSSLYNHTESQWICYAMEQSPHNFFLGFFGFHKMIFPLKKQKRNFISTQIFFFKFQQRNKLICFGMMSKICLGQINVCIYIMVNIEDETKLAI